eukprot:3728717-Pleurochrysis_carterae.AAC.1
MHSRTHSPYASTHSRTHINKQRGTHARTHACTYTNASAGTDQHADARTFYSITSAHALTKARARSHTRTLAQTGADRRVHEHTHEREGAFPRARVAPCAFF